MHWPKVSLMKKKEMDNLKEITDNKRSLEIRQSLNTSSNSHLIRGKLSSNRSERNHFNQKTDYLSISNPTLSNLKKKARDSKSSYSIIKAPKRKWKENNMIPKPPPKREPQVVDYLLKQRQKREKSSEAGRYRKIRTPYLDIKDSSTGRNDKQRGFFNNSSFDSYGLSKGNLTIDKGEEKAEQFDKIGQIREKARMIERDASRKEQLLKFQDGSITENVDVNDLYIDAITAKLQILDNL
mmetsp:Transcript_31480/g.30972  ORF Transcript_31480/g.30972 Transcript_31480/m.30972 type:complete len:239 (+) Transcript_31480:448-1164(+)